MNIDDWFQWPTKSTDPAANAAIAVLLAMVIIAAVVMGALFLLPVVLVFGLAKGIHWYVNKPTPTDQLYAQAQQHAAGRPVGRCRRVIVVSNAAIGGN